MRSDRSAGRSRAPEPGDLLDWWELQRRLALAPERCHSLLSSSDLGSALGATRGLTPRGHAVSVEGWDALAARGWRALPWPSRHYPRSLRALSDPPAMLWVRGDLRVLERPRVAFVGARRATHYGLQAAGALSTAVAEGGAVVVSGLARGIDAAAHRGALSGSRATATTIAVLAHGPDFLYPAAHRELAEAIAERGALVSEFPPGVGPRKPYFPLRNRIISGLCRAVVVVEARRRSGSLVTARHALEQGRDVLAVPGPIDVASSEGSNLLLRDGAGVALDASDVLQAIGLDPVAPPPRSASNRPPKPGDRLGQAIAEGPASLDELARRLGCAVEDVARKVVALELDGLARVGEDGRIYRGR